MVTNAYAMANNAAQQGGRGGYEGIIMLVVMFAIFYFLLIRPQQKRARQHKEMVESLKTGDQVVTAGGIHGRIVSVQDDIINIEIASGVKIKVNRPSVMAVSE